MQHARRRREDGAIAGARGRVLVDGASIDHLPPGQRRAGIVFQNYALFPHLTVARNVAYGLEAQGAAASEVAHRVGQMLELVRLDGRGKKRPHELSGGMRQRGALARVLAQDAPIALMDEPFGALDAMTRDSMHDEIERIHAELGLTIVFVTHNVREAVRLSDRTVLFTSSPGQVKTEYAVDLPRPRHFEDIPVATLSGELTSELKAEVAGTMRAIHVENAEPVEYGQLLFEIDPVVTPPAV